MGKKPNTGAWDRYWHSDRLASCFDKGGSNYPEEFIEEWQAFFENLPEGANILDLCTGNGAIARIAAEISKENSLNHEITGVDQAAIDPGTFASKTPGQDAISFFGEVPAEDLPFPDDNFEAIVSQYGIEYTDLKKTVPEVARVTSKKARAQLLCHTEESVQTRNAREELNRLELVIGKFRIYEIAAAATDAVWKAEHGQATIEAANEQLKAFQGALNSLAALARKTPNNPYLLNTYGLLRHTFEVRSHFELPVLLDKISEAKNEGLAHRARVQALFDAALGESDKTRLAALFEAEGFTPLEIKDFYLEENEKQAGVIFRLERLA